MNNTIKLHHIGEVLVGEIIKNLGCKKFNTFLSERKNKPNDFEVSYMDFLDTDVEIDNKFEIERINNSAEAPQKNWRYDGGHRIDVTVFLKENICFPIEVKMGKDGVANSWESFSENINQVEMKEVTNSNTLKGSVPSFLGKKIDQKISNELGDLKVIRNNDSMDKAAYKEWGLVVRESQIEKFNLTSSSLIKKLPMIISFEELVQFYENKRDLASVSIEDLLSRIFNISKKNLLKDISKRI